MSNYILGVIAILLGIYSVSVSRGYIQIIKDKKKNIELLENHRSTFMKAGVAVILLGLIWLSGVAEI